MIKYTTKKIEEKVAENIECDVCKKIYNYEKDWTEIQEFQMIRFRAGFGSVFGDGAAYRLDICQHCLKDLLGKYIVEDEEGY